MLSTVFLAAALAVPIVEEAGVKLVRLEPDVTAYSASTSSWLHRGRAPGKLRRNRGEWLPRPYMLWHVPPSMRPLLLSHLPVCPCPSVAQPIK